MALNNNNNNELREELTQLQNKVKLISDNTKKMADYALDAITMLKCEVWKCNGNEPILIDGKLPNPSRIGQLEDRLKDLEHKHHTHTHHNPTAELNETRSRSNREMIRDLRRWRHSLGDGFVPPVEEDDNPGAGGGKRRKRKTRKKRRKKKTKKRRRKKKKKKKTKRRR